jgi:hypothetical protein
MLKEPVVADFSARLTRMRLAVLSSATIAHVVPGLRVAALRRGFFLDVFAGGVSFTREDSQRAASYAASAQREVPTKRNGVISGLFRNLGFEPTGDARHEGPSVWQMPVEGYVPRKTFIHRRGEPS